MNTATDYSEALKNAPEWIKMAWEEYNKMGSEYMSKNPFLWFVLGDGKGTPPYKMSKKESKYKDPTPYPNLYCGNCIYYYVQPLRNVGLCSWIKGKVDYDAFCKFWKGLNKEQKSGMMGIGVKHYAPPAVPVAVPLFEATPEREDYAKMVNPKNR